MASQLVAGKGVPLKGKPEAGQDEMALKRQYTKTREAGKFPKFPGVNFISSITVRDGITTLSA
jgi:hypothetical protein